ncbi:MAG: uroporphyrinogen decarboxylase family protein [Sedimentisphaeraceae bacterium JB056]
MNSRERVLAVFEHEIPDRVPCWCGASVEFWEKAKNELKLDDESLQQRFHNDFRRVFPKYTGPEFPLEDPKATCHTPFRVEREGYGYGQPLSHPLANADISDVHDYPWPNSEWMDVSSIKDEAQSYEGNFAILGGEWSPFWHDAIDLFGMEDLYIKMYNQPEVVDAVLEHIVDYYFEVSKNIFDAAGDSIDIFFIGNDFGSQTGPLMSPGMFQRFIVPHLRRLCNLGHSYNIKTQMHCCGGIYELIPSMIAAGVDALHAVQSSCRGMDLGTLKQEFGSRIVFNGAIDSHHTLIDKEPAGVKEDTCRVLEIMMGGGGYIAGASHDTILEDTSVQNVLTMFDTVVEFGNYH